ncbi:hypothetical protein HDU81_002513 [Chytriomyces hyalinus]|nr:hypothetical protein HDU81_002513 [Chytriomyces hyalinus]
MLRDYMAWLRNQPSSSTLDPLRTFLPSMEAEPMLSRSSSVSSNSSADTILSDCATAYPSRSPSTDAALCSIPRPIPFLSEDDEPALLMIGKSDSFSSIASSHSSLTIRVEPAKNLSIDSPTESVALSMSPWEFLKTSFASKKPGMSSRKWGKGEGVWVGKPKTMWRISQPF